MTNRNKRIVKDVAATGANTIWGIILLALRAVATVLLIAVTTLAVFAAIFCIYCKTNIMKDLDVDFNDFALHESSVIYAKNNRTGKYEELVTIASTEYRIWVNYEDIPKDVEHAVVSIEDKRFYEHNGVDWYRTLAAFVTMFLGDDTFGGSTVTQQLIKNVTLDNDVTVQRKFKEIFRALELEKKYSKEVIMERYLNEVYFGHGCYGIGAAAKFYFGKEVSELTTAEAACIVGITNNPSLYSPYASMENNKTRQEEILNQMCLQGYITEEQYEESKNETLKFDEGDDEEENTEECRYTWFEEALIDDVIRDFSKRFNLPINAAEMLLLSGGYKIYATVDLDIQKDIDSIYNDVDNAPYVTGSSQQVQSAITVVDPYTGYIVGMSGGFGKKEGDLVFNRATDAVRQPGSSIKPLSCYAPAIEYEVATPNTRIEDSEDVSLYGTDWMPHNDDWSYDGIITLRQALISSVNTVAAQLVDKLTPTVSYNFVKDMAGLTTLEPDDESYSPLALGALTYGTTTRDMASAYTMFVNKGVRSKGITYSAVYDNNWSLLYENKPEQVAAISEKTAYWVTDMMQDATWYGTGYEARLDDMPTAGKTGTTDTRNDRWYVGCTPYYTAAVWTGYDSPTTMSCDGNPSSQLFYKVMSLIHENLEYREFYEPEDTYLTPIPGVTPYEVHIKGIDEETGKVLYNEVMDKKVVVGRKVTATAKDVQDYNLTSEKEVTITIVQNDSCVNEIIFKYKAIPKEKDKDKDKSKEKPGDTPGDGENTPTDETLEPPQTPESEQN